MIIIFLFFRLLKCQTKMVKIDPTDPGTKGEGAAAQSMRDLLVELKQAALGNPIIEIEKEGVMKEDQLIPRQTTIMTETIEDQFHMT